MNDCPTFAFSSLSLKFRTRINSEKSPFASIYQILSGIAGENISVLQVLYTNLKIYGRINKKWGACYRSKYSKKIDLNMKKSKKISNGPCAEPSTIIGYIATIVVFGFISKSIYDKICLHNCKKLMINDIILSVTDQIWIAKNFFLCERKYDSCWNDVFIHFLM